MGKDLNGKEIGCNLSQEKSGYYSARFTDHCGKRQHKRFLTLKEAKAWLNEAIYLDTHSDIVFKKEMTVNEWFSLWIDQKKQQYKISTYERSCYIFNKHIKPYIGELRIQDVRPYQCQELLNIQAETGAKRGTINGTLSVLSCMMKSALNNSVITRNPANLDLLYRVGEVSSKKRRYHWKNKSIFLRQSVVLLLSMIVGLFYRQVLE